MANATFATLKISWMGRGFILARQKLCVKAQTVPMMSVSGKLSSTIAASTKTNNTDIVPVIPGSLTFKQDPGIASKR